MALLRSFAAAVFTVSPDTYLDDVVVFARLDGGTRAWWLTTRRGQPLITTTKGYRRHAGVGVQHAKPVTSGLPKLGLADELADSSVFVGNGKSNHSPPLQRCTRTKVPTGIT